MIRSAEPSYKHRSHYKDYEGLVRKPGEFADLVAHIIVVSHTNYVLTVNKMDD